MTEISVIIPTFNRSKKVSRAISSVLSQTFTDFEIIVVDDCSVDETPYALARFKEDIKVIRHERNRGVAEARNSGIQAARSPIIAFLDSDDYWLPEKLDVQQGFFRQNPDAMICQTEEVWIRNGKRVNPGRRHLKRSGDIFEPSLKLCIVSPSAVMLKRSLLEEVGPFDHDFPVCEDYDLWLRIACQYPVHLIGRPLVVREGGAPDQLSASQKGMDRFRIRSMIKLLQGRRLRPSQITALYRELEAKCRIYGEGCIKRGKEEEGRYYLGLPERMKQTFPETNPLEPRASDRPPF